MNKKELTAQVAKKTGFTFTESEKCVNAVFQSIRENTIIGKSTTIRGFGSFSALNRVERHGFNPATQQPIRIAAHWVMKFKPSKNIEIK